MVKPACVASAVVSCVVTMPNVMVAAAVAARMYSLPAPGVFSHSIVCCVDAASAFEATVIVMIVADDVAAVSVAKVLPTSTVHTGTFPVTKIAELAVTVIVSDRSCAPPAVPVLRTPSEDGVKMNLCLMGAMPSVSWLYDVAEPQTTEVESRVVYVAAVDVVVSVVVTVVNETTRTCAS